MHKEAREELRVRFKHMVLEYAKHFGATEACQELNAPRSKCQLEMGFFRVFRENGR